MGLAVGEGLHDGAFLAGVFAVLEQLEAFAHAALAEVLPEAAVGLHQAVVLVHHGDVTGHGVEQTVEFLARGAQLLLKAVHLGDVHGQFDDQLHLSVVVQDGRGCAR